MVLLILKVAAVSSQSVTTITIRNARETAYKKSEETGNDTIILEGSVELTVAKDDSESDIKADRIEIGRAHV